MNFFLSLWHINSLSIAGILLASIIIISAVLMSVNVFRHEGNAGAISPKHRKRAVALVLGAIIAGYIAIATSDIAILWFCLQVLAFVSVASLTLYERANTKDLLYRFGARALFGLVCGAIGIGMMKLAMVNTLFGLDLSFMSSNVIAKPAFILILFGFGTSIGLAPMHAGLAELYSKITSPLVALIAPLSILSGALGLFRVRQIIDTTLADDGLWTGNLFLVFGMITVVILAFSMVKQHNYKKLFAEVSMFHVGLMSVMIGFGRAGIIPALMHLVGTVILTGGLFGIAGILHATYKTTKESGLRRIFALQPISATLLGALLLGSIGIPFSSISASMMVGFGYGIQFHGILTGIVMLACVLTAMILISFLVRLVTQHQEDAVLLLPVRWRLSLGAVSVLTCSLLIFGWYIGTQDGVKAFVDAAQLIVEL